jgi:hypothetical protein
MQQEEAQNHNEYAFLAQFTRQTHNSNSAAESRRNQLISQLEGLDSPATSELVQSGISFLDQDDEADEVQWGGDAENRLYPEDDAPRIAEPDPDTEMIGEGQSSRLVERPEGPRIPSQPSIDADTSVAADTLEPPPITEGGWTVLPTMETPSDEESDAVQMMLDV